MGGETETPAVRPGLKASTKKQTKDNTPKHKAERIRVSDLFKWRDEIRGPNGPSRGMTRLVLAALSTHMNRNAASCYPTIDQLSKEFKTSDKTIRRHLDLADNEGWIARETHARDGQEWRNYLYFASIPVKAPVGDTGAYDEQEKGPVSGAKAPVSGSQSSGSSFQKVRYDVPTSTQLGLNKDPKRTHGADAPFFFEEENSTPSPDALQDEKAEGGFSNERTLTDSDLASEPWVTAVTLLNRLDRMSHADAKMKVRGWVGEYGQPHIAAILAKAPKNNPRRFHDFVMAEFNPPIRIGGRPI